MNSQLAKPVDRDVLPDLSRQDLSGLKGVDLARHSNGLGCQERIEADAGSHVNKLVSRAKVILKQTHFPEIWQAVEINGSAGFSTVRMATQPQVVQGDGEQRASDGLFPGLPRQ